MRRFGEDHGVDPFDWSRVFVAPWILIAFGVVAIVLTPGNLEQDRLAAEGRGTPGWFTVEEIRCSRGCVTWGHWVAPDGSARIEDATWAGFQSPAEGEVVPGSAFPGTDWTDVYPPDYAGDPSIILIAVVVGAVGAGFAAYWLLMVAAWFSVRRETGGWRRVRFALPTEVDGVRSWLVERRVPARVTAVPGGWTLVDTLVRSGRLAGPAAGVATVVLAFGRVDDPVLRQP